MVDATQDSDQQTLRLGDQVSDAYVSRGIDQVEAFANTAVEPAAATPEVADSAAEVLQHAQWVVQLRQRASQ